MNKPNKPRAYTWCPNCNKHMESAEGFKGEECVVCECPLQKTKGEFE